MGKPLDDEVAAARAAQDQSEQGARDLAGMFAAYYDELLKKGLERAEALELTAGYQREFWATARRGNQMEQTRELFRGLLGGGDE